MTQMTDKDILALNELSDECLKGNFGFGITKIKKIRRIANKIKEEPIQSRM